LADGSPAFHSKSSPDEESGLRAFHFNQVYLQSSALVFDDKFNFLSVCPKDSYGEPSRRPYQSWIFDCNLS